MCKCVWLKYTGTKTLAACKEARETEPDEGMQRSHGTEWKKQSKGKMCRRASECEMKWERNKVVQSRDIVGEKKSDIISERGKSIYYTRRDFCWLSNNLPSRARNHFSRQWKAKQGGNESQRKSKTGKNNVCYCANPCAYVKIGTVEDLYVHHVEISMSQPYTHSKRIIPSLPLCHCSLHVPQFPTSFRVFL